MTAILSVIIILAAYAALGTGALGNGTALMVFLGIRQLNVFTLSAKTVYSLLSAVFFCLAVGTATRAITHGLANGSVLGQLHGSGELPVSTAHISIANQSAIVILPRSTVEVPGAIMTHGAEFNVVDEYTVFGSSRGEWEASNVTITSADLRKGIIDVTVTNNTDVELTVKLGEELAFARGPLGTTAQAREAPRAPLILRARCTTWSPLTRSWTTPPPSTTTRSPDASRTSPPCHDSTGRWTSSLFIRSEFVKKMNEQNRTAWLWSYESQKRSEH